MNALTIPHSFESSDLGQCREACIDLAMDFGEGGSSDSLSQLGFISQEVYEDELLTMHEAWELEEWFSDGEGF